MKKTFIPILLCCVALSGCGNTAIDAPSENSGTVDNQTEGKVELPAEVNLVDNITYEELSSENQYVVKFKNDNDMDILLEAEILFKDAAGETVETAFDSIFCFQRNSSGVLAFEMPHTESKYIDGVTAELSLRASETGIFAPESSSVDKFTLTENQTENGAIAVSCTNNSDKMVDNVRLMCIYYLGGIPVGHDEYVYLECEAGGTFDYTFYKPYDSILGDMEFDSYEVYLLSAFDDN